MTVEGGFDADGDAAAAIAAALAAAGPARPCELRHTRYAVLQVRGDAAYVELDGCLRLLAPDGTLRQGTAALVALVDP